jgi:hypothetical protein
MWHQFLCFTAQAESPLYYVSAVYESELWNVMLHIKMLWGHLSNCVLLLLQLLLHDDHENLSDCLSLWVVLSLSPFLYCFHGSIITLNGPGRTSTVSVPVQWPVIDIRRPLPPNLRSHRFMHRCTKNGARACVVCLNGIALRLSVALRADYLDVCGPSVTDVAPWHFAIRFPSSVSLLARIGNTSFKLTRGRTRFDVATLYLNVQS